VKDYTILGLLGKYQDAKGDMSSLILHSHLKKENQLCVPRGCGLMLD